VSQVFTVEVMLEPGAKTSRHEPQFENDERVSLDVVAPTVSAFGVAEGEELHAFAFELPAATAYATPSAIEPVTASFRGWKYPPPRLMFATASSPGSWSAVTQSTPSMT
jgi:hypothetical protein